MRGAVLMTVVGALLPGAGFFYARRPKVGWAVALGAVAVVVGTLLWVPWSREQALDFVLDPTRARLAGILLVVVLGVWLVVVAATFLVLRPVPAPRWRLTIGVASVLALAAIVAAPTTVAARYAMVQADLVETVFKSDGVSTTTPDSTDRDPWAGQDRLTILLLGGDGGEGRIGVRTDSMIVLTVDVSSGRAVTFSLPRNMMNAQFPEGTKLHELYPYGFTGPGDPGSWMLNAVYRDVPLTTPDAIGKSDNPGADALKLAVEGSTGLKVDYYFLVNLEGFKKLIDAMGGVTVNINTQVAVGGNTDAGIPPDYYRQPGPDQHLTGFKALWFARGRYGADDYQRMERQRCMVDAIVDQANPLNLFRRFGAIAKASKGTVFTDIPQHLLPDLVNLALKVKDKPMRSVVFTRSEAFDPGDPDFDALRDTVAKAIERKRRHTGDANKTTIKNKDVCAYTGPAQ